MGAFSHKLSIISHYCIIKNINTYKFSGCGKYFIHIQHLGVSAESHWTKKAIFESSVMAKVSISFLSSKLGHKPTMKG